MRLGKIIEYPPRAPDAARETRPGVSPPPFQPRPSRTAFQGLLKAAVISAIFWAAIALLILWLR
jgi:uncharacterized RDD family membrane protein YckC